MDKPAYMPPELIEKTCKCGRTYLTQKLSTGRKILACVVCRAERRADEYAEYKLALGRWTRRSKREALQFIELREYCEMLYTSQVELYLLYQAVEERTRIVGALEERLRVLEAELNRLGVRVAA
jgi:hypothetical protein